MLVEIGETQGLGIDDQQPQDPVTLREVTDRPTAIVVDPDCDELGEPRSVLVDDAERSVAGIGQFDGGLGDPPQHVRQFEVGRERLHRVQELPQTPRAGQVSHGTTPVRRVSSRRSLPAGRRDVTHASPRIPAARGQGRTTRLADIGHKGPVGEFRRW